MLELDELQRQFRDEFKKEPQNLYEAPGRVNIIGEHTDYNNGFVFPVCIDRYIRVLTAATPNSRKVTIRSLDFNNVVSFDLDEVAYKAEDSWGNYVKGVVKTLQQEGHRLAGMEMLFSGNIPVASGLSSSAAIEVVSAVAFSDAARLKLDPVTIARICQKSENEFIGVKCGIMDQFIIAAGKRDQALFLDCQDLSYQHIPFDLKDIALVICNSKVKRELKSSEYNLRREECAAAVQSIQKKFPSVRSLRDATEEILKSCDQELSGNSLKRARHVIGENERVKKTAELAREGKFGSIGELLQDSHQSLRDDYQVSCPELDALVEAALEVDGVYGSRMTGAGFGGCTLALVKNTAVKNFTEHVRTRYKEKTSIEAELYVCRIVHGARRLIEPPS